MTFSKPLSNNRFIFDMFLLSDIMYNESSVEINENK